MYIDIYIYIGTQHTHTQLAAAAESGDEPERDATQSVVFAICHHRHMSALLSKHVSNATKTLRRAQRGLIFLARPVGRATCHHDDAVAVHHDRRRLVEAGECARPVHTPPLLGPCHGAHRPRHRHAAHRMVVGVGHLSYARALACMHACMHACVCVWVFVCVCVCVCVC